MNATTEDYAALGFGTSMTGSDIIIIKFNGENAPILMDTKGVGHTLPTNYTSNNLDLIAYDVSGPRKRV